MPKRLFDIFEGHPFDGDHCFLCGIELTSRNRTVEHVFPRWLQEAFAIRDHTITLLNGTRIPYRSLVIPCCKICNGVHLSKLESRVASVILDDARSLEEICDQDLNAWVSKIYIGILWKELELRFDIKSNTSDSILPKEAMDNFRMVHFFMQSCRENMLFKTPNDKFPNSFLKVECKVPLNREEQFDYMDNFLSHSIAIRLGRKGILGVFDGGIHELIFPDFAERQFDNKPLHPVQFKEIFAKLTYKSTLSLRVPYFGLIEVRENQSISVNVLAYDDYKKRATAVAVGLQEGPIVMMPILPDGVDESPFYDEWSQEEFAKYLSTYTGIPLERLFVPPDLVGTTIRNDVGEFVDLPL